MAEPYSESFDRGALKVLQLVEDIGRLDSETSGNRICARAQPDDTLELGALLRSESRDLFRQEGIGLAHALEHIHTPSLARGGNVVSA